MERREQQEGVGWGAVSSSCRSSRLACRQTQALPTCWLEGAIALTVEAQAIENDVATLRTGLDALLEICHRAVLPEGGVGLRCGRGGEVKNKC